MSLWHIAWNYLWNRKLPTCLTILSVALAAGLISAVLTLRDETRKRFEEEGSAFDIVVGAKGSPLQLVLSTVYFMDIPPGNILLSDYEKLKQHEDVAAAYPINMGDTYKGFRIVGTTPEIFNHEYSNASGRVSRKLFQLADGRFFEKSMEAVLGSTVARSSGLQVGDTFIGAHGYMDMPDGMGHVHDKFPYTVVGILKPSGSPMDRAIFADLNSVWEIHKDHGEDKDKPEEYSGPYRPGVNESVHETTEHDSHEAEENHEHEHEHEHGHDHENEASKEITAVLIKLQSPALQFQFKEFVNSEYNAMAARPISEIANLYAQLLGTAKTVLLAIGYLVVVISALSISIGLYLSIIQRKRDLAIMRALGASRTEILGAVMIEALWVTLLGIGSGWILGGGMTGTVGLYLSQRYGLYVSPFGLTNEHLLAFGTVAFVGMLAGIIPAWQAYRTDVARDLAEL